MDLPQGARGLARRIRAGGAGGEAALLGVAGLALVVGGLLHLSGRPDAAGATWAVAAGAGLVASVWWVVQTARQGRVGVDVVAVLALAGTLLVGQPLAGNLIALMLASGRVLEAWAARRARSAVAALVERAPRTLHRLVAGGIEDVEPELVAPGDRLLVRSGEVVPVDGLVGDEPAVLDESAITGESVLVEHPEGDLVRSGASNAGDAFALQATATVADSTYAGIVALVADAEASDAPFVRVADRYALVFLAVAVAGSALAALLSGSLVRGVAVLVVATPCPLILAAPVAIVSGLSRAAGLGVLVKDGAALERLALSHVLLFDKTGTLTAGRPTVAEVRAARPGGEDEVLRLAASVSLPSAHVVAASLVRAAGRRDLPLELPEGFVEEAGRGTSGRVDGHQVRIGSGIASRDAPPDAADQAASQEAARDAPGSWSWATRRRAELDGALLVEVEVDGRATGLIRLDDAIRGDAASAIRGLHGEGIRRVVMLSGDRADVAGTVGAVIGADEVFAERSPAEKAEVVRAEQETGPCVMVGDGINDAPALAIADVGVAVGANGVGAAAEVADVVLLTPRLDRLVDGVRVARRARGIALQSVVAGLAMSGVAMAVAALGWLPPTWGALLQEGIDAVVIVNALRVAGGGEGRRRLSEDDAEVLREFERAHEQLRPRLEQVRTAADLVGEAPDDRAVQAVRDAHRFLVEEVLPHEEADEAELYPVYARAIGGDDPTAPMSRGHLEIRHLVRRLGLLVDQLDPDHPDHDLLLEARRLAYGLHAVLCLHFAQEDERTLSLDRSA